MASREGSARALQRRAPPRAVTSRSSHGPSRDPVAAPLVQTASTSNPQGVEMALAQDEEMARVVAHALCRMQLLRDRVAQQPAQPPVQPPVHAQPPGQPPMQPPVQQPPMQPPLQPPMQPVPQPSAPPGYPRPVPAVAKAEPLHAPPAAPMPVGAVPTAGGGPGQTWSLPKSFKSSDELKNFVLSLSEGQVATLVESQRPNVIAIRRQHGIVPRGDPSQRAAHPAASAAPAAPAAPQQRFKDPRAAAAAAPAPAPAPVPAPAPTPAARFVDPRRAQRPAQRFKDPRSR